MDYRKNIDEKVEPIPILKRIEDGKFVSNNGVDLQRTTEAECKRKIRERIYNLLDNKYKDIIIQQNGGNIHPSKYKPMLTKFFQQGRNFDHLLKDLFDLQKDYEQLKTGLPFQSFVQNILYIIEMSKVGAQLDIKTTEHLKSFDDFSEKI